MTPTPNIREEWKDFIGNSHLSNNAVADWWLERCIPKEEIREQILDIREALVRKARAVDHSDRTEYDEAAEMLDGILTKLLGK